jgi:hypothetical protein
LGQWDRKILKGERIMRRIAAGPQPCNIRCVHLRLANNGQMKMVVAALGIIKQGKMGSSQAETLQRTPASVADVPDRTH